ncbi:MAG: asparagine synthase (glutamine-hydrolyzing) [Ekhidna sp.]
MCGITGYKIRKPSVNGLENPLKAAIHTLSKRGPDAHGTFIHNTVGLGQTRLSILDTSKEANQPMMDVSGRYIMVFNGEIYNYEDLKKSINQTEFKSSGDTEVLLYLLIEQGINCLSKLNGFFSIAFYDKAEESLLIARDRYGIKPLHYYQDDEQLIFGSEMKAVLSYPIKKEIDKNALYWYLKLNYLPGNLSMIDNVQKLEPGHYLQVEKKKVTKKCYLSSAQEKVNSSYKDSKKELVSILDKSVRSRLISDVPLGSFLSGGTDSSAIVALASKYTSNLQTFSIGYRDHPYFDETSYAESVAKKFNTNHTTFKLTNDDLLSDLNAIIEYIDEPFADSSAIPTYILSKHTRKHVTVALSGDGADELFGGYYKHLALSKSLENSFSNLAMKVAHPIFKSLPKSRSGKLSNIFRRLDRYSMMLKQDKKERYWFLASLTNNPTHLLKEESGESISEFKAKYISQIHDVNDYLIVDQEIVLPGDMLTKVDLMSMANSLEVRVPFLDREVVEFARSLPSQYKIKGNHRKRILQDAFKDILPKDIFNRPKKGFEVPLLDWMKNELLVDLDSTLFNIPFLESQHIFQTSEVMSLRKKMFSKNPEDVHGIIWALFIFQKWYSKYF